MPVAPITLLVVLIVGSLTLSIVLPLTVGPSPCKAPTAFETGHPNNHYLARHCLPRKTDWVLASNERQLSNEYFAQSGDIPDPRGLTAFVWVWGQFIDHDIVRTDSNKTAGAPSYTIPFSPSFNMTLFRAINSTNHITPFIDATTVYGDYFNTSVLPTLRASPTSCRLKTLSTLNGQFLPIDPATGLFYAGDVRAAETSPLTVMHTLWMREHNRLCGVLERVAPTGWTDNERFWKARQIVIAKIQKITYEDWLPALFGKQLFAELFPPPTTYGGSGELQIDAEFSVSGYRFGHSMVSNQFGPFELKNLFFNAEPILDHGIEPILNAIQSTATQQCDAKVVDALRNFLFGPAAGEDLVTRNLFRARDMQIPTYTQLTTCYGTTPTNTFPDPNHGLLAEPLVPGSSLPRTTAVIVAEQFRRIRDADPNFYSAPGAYERIGPYFYSQVIYTSLDRIIRDNCNPAKLSSSVVKFGFF